MHLPMPRELVHWRRDFSIYGSALVQPWVACWGASNSKQEARRVSVASRRERCDCEQQRPLRGRLETVGHLEPLLVTVLQIEGVFLRFQNVDRPGFLLGG